MQLFTFFFQSGVKQKKKKTESFIFHCVPTENCLLESSVVVDMLLVQLGGLTVEPLSNTQTAVFVFSSTVYRRLD